MGNTGLAVFYFFFVKRSNPNVMNQKLDLKKNVNVFYQEKSSWNNYAEIKEDYLERNFQETRI